MCSCAMNTRGRSSARAIAIAFASSFASDRAEAVAFASSVKVAEGAVVEAKAGMWQKQWQMKQ